jgi:hypothetical protein
MTDPAFNLAYDHNGIRRRVKDGDPLKSTRRHRAS